MKFLVEGKSLFDWLQWLIIIFKKIDSMNKLRFIQYSISDIIYNIK